MYLIDSTIYSTAFPYEAIFAGGVYRMHPPDPLSDQSIYDNTALAVLSFSGDIAAGGFDSDECSVIYDNISNRDFQEADRNPLCYLNTIPVYLDFDIANEVSGKSLEQIIDTSFPTAITIFIIGQVSANKFDWLQLLPNAGDANWKINSNAGSIRAYNNASGGHNVKEAYPPMLTTFLTTVIFDRTNATSELQSRLWINGSTDTTTVYEDFDLTAAFGEENFAEGHMRLSGNQHTDGILIYAGALDDDNRMAEEARLMALAGIA